MDKETIDRILDGLEKLGEKLGESAVALWGILVKQAIVSGVRYAIAGFVLFGVVVVIRKKLLPLVIKTYPFEEPTGYGSTVSVAGKKLAWNIGTFMVSLVISAIGFACMVGAVSRFINPAYYALHDLLSLVTGL